MAEYNYYKDYPLVRKGNDIIYGYMSEEFVIMMNVQSTKKVDGIDVADKIKVYKCPTNTMLPVKNAERGSLYEALDLAYTWLERA